MSIYQQIEELKAELAGCIFTKAERAKIQTQLAATIAQAEMLSEEIEKTVLL